MFIAAILAAPRLPDGTDMPSPLSEITVKVLPSSGAMLISLPKYVLEPRLKVICPDNSTVWGDGSVEVPFQTGIYELFVWGRVIHGGGEYDYRGHGLMVVETLNDTVRITTIALEEEFRER